MARLCAGRGQQSVETRQSARADLASSSTMGSAPLLTSLVWLSITYCTAASHNHTTPHHHQDMVSHSYQDEDFGHVLEGDEGALAARLGSISTTTWLAAFSSVSVISLVGLLTVGVIPMLAGAHQEAALQLLVSLAVGTLVGDALMHLLPHALQTGHGSTAIIWKGFTASLTIIAFFAMDRVLQGLGHSHSHAPGGHGGSDEENLTVSTRTSRESSPVSKVIHLVKSTKLELLMFRARAWAVCTASIGESRAIRVSGPSLCVGCPAPA